jgi:ABC-type glycerol-3-phosphate transport system permease component
MAMAIEPDAVKATAPLAGTGPGLFGIRKRNRARLVIAVLLSLVSLGPLLYMLSLSFQPNGGLLGATVLIPTHPTVQNYVQAWTENSFSHYLLPLRSCLRRLPPLPSRDTSSR